MRRYGLKAKRRMAMNEKGKTFLFGLLLAVVGLGGFVLTSPGPQYLKGDFLLYLVYTAPGSSVSAYGMLSILAHSKLLGLPSSFYHESVRIMALRSVCLWVGLYSIMILGFAALAPKSFFKDTDLVSGPIEGDSTDIP